MTFSSALKSGRRLYWNTKPMKIEIRLVHGRLRCSQIDAEHAGPDEVHQVPIVRSVLLPDPDGPSNAASSP
jgi:hypothetical protein